MAAGRISRRTGVIRTAGKMENPAAAVAFVIFPGAGSGSTAGCCGNTPYYNNYHYSGKTESDRSFLILSEPAIAHSPVFHTGTRHQAYHGIMGEPAGRA